MSRLRGLVTPLFLLFGTGAAAAQNTTGWEHRIAEADTAVDRCSGDCRFERTRALRLRFARKAESAGRMARALEMAVSLERDPYWIEAFVAVLQARPQEARWVRGYWLDRMDEDGRLPPESRRDLVAEVTRLAKARRESFRGVLEAYTRRAEIVGLDPAHIVHDPFESVAAWLDERS